MDIQRANTDILTEELTVIIEPADYTDRVQNILNNYRKDAQIPGFRKGKVPMALIRKQYAKPVLAEEMNKVLGEKLNAYIQSEKLQVLGSPIPSGSRKDQGNWDEPESFTFVYEIGLAPEVSLDFGRRAKFTRHYIKVDKKTIQTQVTDHCRRHGSLSDPEVAEATDLLIGTMTQLNDEGEVLEDGISNETNISIEHVGDKKTTRSLVGLQAGDHVDVDPHKVSKDHDDLGKMLGISHEAVHDLAAGTFRFDVKEVKRLTPAENNQDLWDKVLGKDVVSDDKSFREKVGEELASQFDRDAEYVFRRRFIVDLIEHIKLEMPDEFLKRWIKVSNDKPITDEQVAKEYPAYAESLRWQLLQQAVMKATEMRVTVEELTEEAKRLVGAQYAQYGMPIEGDMLENFAKKALENEDERRRLGDMIIERKVVDDLKTRVTIRDKGVVFEDFAKLAAEVQ
jgi:trigger factor